MLKENSESLKDRWIHICKHNRRTRTWQVKFNKGFQDFCILFGKNSKKKQNLTSKKIKIKKLYLCQNQASVLFLVLNFSSCYTWNWKAEIWTLWENRKFNGQELDMNRLGNFQDSNFSWIYFVFCAMHWASELLSCLISFFIWVAKFGRLIPFQIFVLNATAIPSYFFTLFSCTVLPGVLPKDHNS